MENVKTGFWGEQISNAPAWLISLTAHSILLLTATVIVFTTQVTKMEEAIIVTTMPPTIEKVKIPDDKDKQRDIFTNNTPKIPDKQPIEDDKEIVFPDAIPSDHNESANNEDFKELKGPDSKAIAHIIESDDSNTIGRSSIGSKTNGDEVIGISGAPTKGSLRGNRDKGGRENLVKIGGGTQGTESAVEHALRWLCRHQNTDGSWSAASFASNCSGVKCSGSAPDEFNVGVSGLALLAFLGNGKTHLSKDIYEDRITHKKIRYGEVVKNAVLWLISQQDSDGAIGKVGQKYMYNHSVATLALAEAYGMTMEKQFEQPARKAVEYLLMAQNRGRDENYDMRAWRYTYRSGENDTSVMGWCVMALKSAEISGLYNRSGSAAYGGAIGWVKDVTEEDKDYRVGYNAKGTGIVSVRGINDSWAGHDALTAIGMLTRMFIEKNKNDPALKNGAKLLTEEENIPKWDNSGAKKQIDYYHWYYASLALFQYDGPKGEIWKKWNEPMKKALLPNQHVTSDGCLDGSWDPEVDRWGFEGGRVYATAINALTLEVYYRYESIFMKK